MSGFFKKNWVYFLSFIFLILGLFYYSKAYSNEVMAFEYDGKAYVFEHPLSIRHMQAHLNRCYSHALVLENCKTNAQKVQFHKENGERCYAALVNHGYP